MMFKITNGMTPRYLKEFFFDETGCLSIQPQNIAGCYCHTKGQSGLLQEEFSVYGG